MISVIESNNSETMGVVPRGGVRTWGKVMIGGVLVFALFAGVGVCEAGSEGSGSGSSTENADTETNSLPDDATLLKMRVRDLKQLLQRKGADAECKACTTKQEFVDRIKETFTWSDVTATPSASAEESMPTMEELRKMFNRNEDNVDVKKLKEQLRKAGINVDVVGNKNGFGNVNVEDITKAYKDIKSDQQQSDGSESANADGASSTGSSDEERTEL